MSALRASTSSTTARLQLIVQMESSDQSRRQLCQVLHRTAANEPLENGARGHKGFEAWHEIVRRLGLSYTKAAYAVLISNISEGDRAKDEDRFGTIRDEEKMLAVKKPMLESLLNDRLRATTTSYSELLLAQLNIIIDKVERVPTARNRKIDTSAPMEIGMAATDDGTGKGKMEFWEGSELERKKDTNVAQSGKDGRKGRTHGRRAVARKEARGRRKVAGKKPEHVGRVARQ